MSTTIQLTFRIQCLFTSEIGVDDSSEHAVIEAKDEKYSCWKQNKLRTYFTF